MRIKSKFLVLLTVVMLMSLMSMITAQVFASDGTDGEQITESINDDGSAYEDGDDFNAQSDYVDGLPEGEESIRPVLGGEPPVSSSESTPDDESSTPEEESSTPEDESSTPEEESSTPEEESSTPEEESSTPSEDESSTPEEESSTPSEEESSTPEEESSTPSEPPVVVQTSDSNIHIFWILLASVAFSVSCIAALHKCKKFDRLKL